MSVLVREHCFRTQVLLENVCHGCLSVLLQMVGVCTQGCCKHATLTACCCMCCIAFMFAKCLRCYWARELPGPYHAYWSYLSDSC